MKILLTLFCLIAMTTLAESAKPFPAHWGEPPKIQTRDYRELPEGYGHGSSTLAKWIEANLAKDAASKSPRRAARVASQVQATPFARTAASVRPSVSQGSSAPGVSADGIL